ncbi:MAG TPA: hypothetical protein VFE51_26335 [Verrucomicrobiae bacterium]|nr:hypothetical protein [Verrucomicrobiae bacterium]
MKGKPFLPVCARRFCPGFRHGFTAIELLAIITVVGLLASLMVRSFAGTRGGVVAVQCRNNLRQLVTGWSMYTADNRGKLVYNVEGNGSGLSAGNEAWVVGYLDFSSSSHNTNTAMLVDHKSFPFGAYLGPYVRDPALFKCPADRSEVVIAGKRFARVRSVSMNNSLGLHSVIWRGPLVGYTNASQITFPSALFIILDERPDSINDGTFMSDPSTSWQIVDFPGAYHNGSGSFCFADGHVEMHRWNDPRTNPIMVPSLPLPFNQNLPGDLDILWLQQHAVGQPP